MKTLRFAALVATVAVAAQAVGVAAPVRAQDNVIRIATQSPLSGGQSTLGIAISNGAQLAVQQLSGPIEELGFTVEVVPFDDQATPEVGVSNAQTIVNDPSILAVIGHLNSGVAIPSSEVYVTADLVMVSPANTGVNVTDRGLATVNRVCGRDDAQGPAGADYVADVLGASTVYVLHDRTAYGEGVATFFRDRAEERGLTVLGFEGTEERANFDALITPIRALAPDVIYFGGIYDQAAVFFSQAREAGIEAQFMGPDGMDNSELANIGGEAVVGTVYTSVAGAIPAEFRTQYEEAFGVQVEPFAPESYASTQIVLAAIEQLLTENGGTLPTRAEVSAAVRATENLETLIGPITFDDNGDPEQANYYIYSVGSADPAEWTGNEVISTVTFPSPLTRAAMEGMEATPEATAGN
jgi:branched-chain amino acid transport system substrate-binding protein